MPTLKRGSTDPDVTKLQQRLKDLGFDPGGIDGNFGGGTETAVIAFQQANGLDADGKVGPNTRAALQLDGTQATAGGGASAGSAVTGAVAATAAAPAAVALNLAALAGKIPAQVLAQIPQTASDFGITSNLRLAHFLAQCALESTGFTATVENLDYSTPQRILKIFGKHFHGIDPVPFVHNAQKLGNHVYANRNGNGDEASGDGFNFRGRGYIQLTGKKNYKAFSQFVGEDCVANPDLVATKFPLSSAAFYFSSNNIWSICDKGADNATVRRVSVAVNGDPPNSLDERIQNFKMFIGALT